MKLHIVRLLYILFSASFCSVLLWHYFSCKAAAPHTSHSIKDKHSAKSTKNNSSDKLLENDFKWAQQENNIQSFRSVLRRTCNAISNAVVTKVNSPLGTNIAYDADKKKKARVTRALFDIFPKESPFIKAPWDTCAVVGNGGILAKSGCGKQIDSVSFVIRCNLPPVSNGHEKDVGNKTNLVTVNPSILFRKYRGLNYRQRTFVNDVQVYGESLLLLPAFSFRRNTAVSLRAVYSLSDLSSSGPQAILFNPSYLRNLAGFWIRQGIREVRLSTGIMMVSLALELCNNVHLYGFWPFGKHPDTNQQLNNHYYDNQPSNKRMHSMPAEFKVLQNLHNIGVIHLHLGKCTN